jgi:hypothetical protein
MTGGEDVQLGQVNLIGKSELAELITTCQEALQWSDLGLARAADISTRMLRSLKTPLDRQQLTAPGHYGQQAAARWTYQQQEAIGKVVAALEARA